MKFVHLGVVKFPSLNIKELNHIVVNLIGMLVREEKKIGLICGLNIGLMMKIEKI